jgi:hypothetical protein
VAKDIRWVATVHTILLLVYSNIDEQCRVLLKLENLV